MVVFPTFGISERPCPVWQGIIHPFRWSMLLCKELSLTSKGWDRSPPSPIDFFVSVAAPASLYYHLCSWVSCFLFTGNSWKQGESMYSSVCHRGWDIGYSTNIFEWIYATTKYI
jgi:hypothetical protein